MAELCDAEHDAGLEILSAELDAVHPPPDWRASAPSLERASANLLMLALGPEAGSMRDTAAAQMRELAAGIQDPGHRAATATEVAQTLRDIHGHVCEPLMTNAGEFVFRTSSDHLQKPHRLTWFAEGRWWAVLRKSGGDGSGWRVWRRSIAGWWDYDSHVLSTIPADRFDVFLNPDDGHVYALNMNSNQSRLLRLAYDAASDMFVVEASAPVPTAHDGEVGTLTVDTAGRVWIALHPDGRFAYTVRDADTLEEIAPLTVLADSVQPRSLVAGRFVDERGAAVGFVYASAEPPYVGNFKVHRDDAMVGDFSTEEFAENVDDHSTYAAAGTDVMVVWKDRRDRVGEPIILIRQRLPDGSWGPPVPVFLGQRAGGGANDTRPRVIIDTEARRVHVAAAEVTSEALEVRERVAPIDTLRFGTYRAIFRSGDGWSGHVFRDVHAGQQPATADSGVLWLARGRDLTEGEIGGFSLWQNLLASPGTPDALRSHERPPP